MADEALNTETDIVNRLRERRAEAGLLGDPASSGASEEAAPEPVEVSETPEPEAAAASPEPTEPDSEPDPAAELADLSEAPSDSGDDDELPISNLADVANHLGVDVSELYKISVPMTGPDGQRVDVSLGEWKDGYRSRDDMQRATQEAQQAREAAEMQANQARVYVQQFTEQMQAYLTQAETLLGADESAVNWSELRELDPAEYTAKKMEFQEKRSALSRIRDEAVAKLREQQAAEMQEQEQRLAHVKQKEEQALLAAIPAWREEATRAAEMSATVEYLKKIGFSDQELESVYNHRVVVVADKARRFDELEAKRKELADHTPAQPGKKVIRPGARKSAPRETAEQRAAREAEASFKKSGKTEDLAASLAAKRAARIAASQSRR